MKKFRILVLAVSAAVIAVFLFRAVRDRITSDSTAPVITADEDYLEISVSATEEDLLAGMQATDNLDGDVTDTLVVVSKTKFISDRTRRVNYAAFDRNNNVGAYSRTITYTDYRSPHFSISQPMRFLNGETVDFLRSVRADDCLDGDLTRQIKITFGQLQPISDTVSAQKLNLLVTNSAGDSADLELTATFEDYTTFNQPAPALSAYIIYVQKGERPDYHSYLQGIWSAGSVRSFSDMELDPSGDIRVLDSTVRYNSPGVYTATFQLLRVGDKAGKTQTEPGTATMIVVVEE